MSPIDGYWLGKTVAMALTAFLIPKLTITNIGGALFTVVAIALVNATIWDAQLFSFVPTAFSTDALLLLLANGVLFWVLVKLLPGIEVEGVLPALVAPVVFTLSSVLVTELGNEVDWDAVFAFALSTLGDIKSYFIERSA